MSKRNGVLVNHSHREKIAKRFSNPRKEGTPCDGEGKRK